MAVKPKPRRPTFNPSFVAADDDWLQELVRFILLVSRLDGGNRIIRCLTLALDQTLGGNLDPLPSLVTIHGVIPADDGNELSDLLLLDEIEEFLRILGGGTGSGVTTIAEEVDVDVWNLELLCGLKKRIQVGVVGVHASIGDLQVIL